MKIQRKCENHVEVDLFFSLCNKNKEEKYDTENSRREEYYFSFNFWFPFASIFRCGGERRGKHLERYILLNCGEEGGSRTIKDDSLVVCEYIQFLSIATYSCLRQKDLNNNNNNINQK